MDYKLQTRLDTWWGHITVLEDMERRFLHLEGLEKSLFGELYKKTEGSIPERESEVHSSKDWTDFKKGLAEAKAMFMKSKRQLDFYIKAYEAEYLECKQVNEAIRRPSA